MTRTASAALGGGVVLLLVWKAATGAPSPAVPLQRDTPPAAQTPVPVDLDREAVRLHERLANSPKFPPPQRDPFSFGTKPPAPVRARALPASPPMPVVVEAPPPVSDAPRLLAVLTDAGDGGPLRRAVLGIGDDVQILRIGDTVTHYRIRSIGADALEFVDVVTGAITRVTLR
jgi:hypothetical protein